jgi:hypothetical protein
MFGFACLNYLETKKQKKDVSILCWIEKQTTVVVVMSSAKHYDTVSSIGNKMET